MRTLVSLILIFSLVNASAFAQALNDQPDCGCLARKSGVVEAQAVIKDIYLKLENRSLCKGESSTGAQLECMKKNLKGFFKDGLGGDLSFFKEISSLLAKETGRALVSAAPAGGILLNHFGVESTDQKLVKFVRFWGPQSLPVAKVMFRLSVDPPYQAEIATKVLDGLNIFLGDAVHSSSEMSCTQVYSKVCEVMGNVGYQAIMIIIMGLLTAEAGGAGGAAKTAQVIQKLSKTSPKVAEFLKELTETLKSASTAEKQSEALVQGANGTRDRTWIKSFYAKNDEASAADKLAGHVERLEGTQLFADHGVRHVEDVVAKSKSVMEDMNEMQGITGERAEFRQELTQELAYLHDIGMSNPAMRSVHPEFATQAAFSPEFDKAVLDQAWDNGNSVMAKRLIALKNQGHLEQEPKDVLRELLSMSNAHSKTKVARSALEHDGAKEMRAIMQHAAGTDINVLKAESDLALLLKTQGANPTPETLQKIEALRKEIQSATKEGHGLNAVARSHYANFDKDSYKWLAKVDSDPELKLLWDDTRNPQKAVSIGDVMRQRGVALRTSGEHQVILDKSTGQTVIAIRDTQSGRITYYGSNNPIHAGESNIAMSDLKNGNLRIAFQTGQGLNPEASRKILKASTLVVEDIANDAMILGKNQKLIIEAPVDNPQFAQQLKNELVKNPRYKDIEDRIIIKNPEAKDIAVNEIHLNQIAGESKRYVAATTGFGTLPVESQKSIITSIAAAGGRSDAVELAKGLNNAKIIEVHRGDTLMVEGQYGKYAYVVLDSGFEGVPTGGYTKFKPAVGSVVGEGGVLRGGERNATITAVSSKPARVLMIPEDDYLRFILNRLDSSDTAQALEAP